MVRDDPPLLRAHHPFFLESGDQPIDGRLEVFRPDRRLVLSCREQRRFVHQVGEIGAGESRRARGNDLEVDVRRHLHALGVDAKNFLAAFDVRLVDQHLAIEAAGPKQRRVEHLGAVGGAHDDDALARVEPVHLGEQLIQRLLALFVAADGTLHAHFTQRIEFVDEHDAGRLGLGLLKEIADARRADADKHLDELRAAQAEKRDVRFAGDRAGEQGLAGARGADEQHPFRNAAAEVGVLARVLQELHDFHQLFARLVHSGDIGEPDLHFVVGEDLGLAPRERHHAALGAAHPAEEEPPDGDEEEERQQPPEQLGQPPVDHFTAVFDAVRFELFGELRIFDPVGRELHRGLGAGADCLFELAANQPARRRSPLPRRRS